MDIVIDIAASDGWVSISSTVLEDWLTLSPQERADGIAVMLDNLGYRD